MKIKIKNKANYLLIVIITICSCFICYGKSIDLNGLKINLKTNVSKDTINVGKSINSDKDSGSKETKVSDDEYVKAELIVKNDNPYEVANVTIEEIKPGGFKQLDSSKNDVKINIKLGPKSDKKIEYIYRYHKSFLKDQNNSILYDENGNIIDNNKNISHEASNNKNTTDENRKYKISNNKNKGNIDEEANDLKKGAFYILKFILVFIGCVVLLFVFIMLYKTIKGNDDNFFDNVDGFKGLIIFILISISMNICFSNMTLAKNVYVPQVYEYGKTYEKVIYEPIYFNDGLYRFAYKISFTFESSYLINDEDYENDTDGDGLVDAFEYQYMTDKNNVDTDGDGLSDYTEVMYLDYNPLSDDTFNDGIKDSDRDFDGDKLTNIEEVNYGTDLFNVDTDYDTLSDYDELNKYGTDPLSIDTDEDLLSDPDELKLGLDPTNPRTDGITLDSERKVEQEYTITNVPEELREGNIFISKISGSISGNIDNEVNITKKNNEVFNSMSSYVQSGFEVSLKDDEKIDIELDVNKVLERKTSLTVVRFLDGELEVIDTICEDDTLKAKVGNGVYTVMDSDIVLRDLSVFLDDYIG